MAPVAEELIFRKALIDGLSRYGEGAAVFASGLVFGLAHGNFSQCFYAFGLGLAFGYIYVKSGKIHLTILPHAALNCISVLMSKLVLPRVLPLVEKLTEATTPEETERLITGELPALAVTGLYASLLYGAAFLGLIFFIIYYRRIRLAPANLFVAGFIGMPRMNTFDAQLQRDPDGKFAVQLANAHVVLSDEKQARLAQKNVQPGPIVLGIRPEHIMLAGEGEQMIHGTVDVSEMMGSAVHLHLQACGRDTIIIVQTMSMQGATNSSFGIGQSIAFTFGGNVVHVFDPETGKNLEF